MTISWDEGCTASYNSEDLCAREIISALYGEAETRPPLAAGKGVMLMINNKVPHTFGAELTARRVPEACEPD